MVNNSSILKIGTVGILIACFLFLGFSFAFNDNFLGGEKAQKYTEVNVTQGMENRFSELKIASKLSGDIIYENDTIKVRGHNYEHIVNKDGSVNTLFYIESKYFDEYVTMDDSGDDLVLCVNKKCAEIVISFEDDKGKKEKASKIEKEDKKAKPMKINKHVERMLNDENETRNGYHFYWDITDIPDKNRESMSAISIEFMPLNDTEIEFKQEGNTIEFQGLVLDLTDIVKSGFKLEKGDSDKEFKVKDNPATQKSIKTKDIFLDPYTYTSSGDGVFVTTDLDNVRVDNTLDYWDDGSGYSLYMYFAHESQIPKNAIFRYANLHFRVYTGSTSDTTTLYPFKRYYQRTTTDDTSNDATTNGSTSSERWFVDNANDGCSDLVTDEDWCSTSLTAGQDYYNDAEFSSSFTPTTGWHSIDVGAWVNASAIRKEYDSNGWLFRNSDGSNLRVYLSEYSGTDNDPYLNISWYTPSPVYTPLEGFTSEGQSIAQQSDSFTVKYNYDIVARTNYSSDEVTSPIITVMNSTLGWDDPDYPANWYQWDENSSIEGGSVNYSVTYTSMPEGVYLFDACAEVYFPYISASIYYVCDQFDPEAGDETPSYGTIYETLYIDSTNPTINFTSPTPADGGNTTSATTTINLTDQGGNAPLDTCLIDWNGVNQSMDVSGLWADDEVVASGIGTQTYKVWCNDTAGNSVTSATRTFDVVDTTDPVVVLSYPVDYWVEYISTDPFDLNFSATDDYLDTCWYTYDNQDGYNGSVIVSCDSNTTVSLPDDYYDFTMMANDSSGNEGGHMVFMVLDSTAPNLTLDYPVDGTTYSVAPTDLNFTLDEDNPNLCWYSIDGGATNHSNSKDYVFQIVTGEGSSTGSGSVSWNNAFINDQHSSFLSPLSDNDVVYGLDIAGQTASSFNYETFDDGGASEATNFMWMATSDSWTTRDGSLLTSCEFGDFGQGSASFNIDFSSAYTDSDYSVILNTQDDDATLCFVDTDLGSKDAGDFDVKCNDDGGADEVPIYVSFCTFDYGEYSMDTGLYVKAGEDVADSTGGFSVTFDDPFPDANYNVFVTHVNDDGGDGCVCHTESRSTTGFTVECYDDGASQSACDYDTYTYTAISQVDLARSWGCYNVTDLEASEGSNTWTMWANDDVGFSTSDSITFTVDTTPPVVTIIDPSSDDNWYYEDIQVNYTAVDGSLDTCFYSLNGGANTTIGGCANLSIDWEQGQNNLTIYANDTAGGLGSDSVRFYIDDLYPQIEWGSGVAPNNTVRDGNWFYYNTSYVENNVNHFDYYYNTFPASCTDGSAFPSATDYFNRTGMPDGKYTYCTQITDDGGKTNVTSELVITLDGNAPTIEITSPSEDGTYTTNNSINIEWDATDTYLSACWWTRDAGATNTSVTCDETITGETWDEGTNTITFYANDTAGHIGSASRQFYIDNTAPTVSFGGGLNTVANGGMIERPKDYLNINVTCSEESGYHTLRLYNETSLTNEVNSTLLGSGCSWVWGITGLDSEGWLYYNVTAYDGAGNSNESDTWSALYDTADPVLTIDAPASDNQWYSVNTTDITFTATDANRDSCWYSLDGGSNTSRDCDTDFTTETWSEGAHTITIWVNDSTGTEVSATRTWNVDSVAPVVSIVYPATDDNFYTSHIEVNYTASDLNLDSCWWNTNGGSNTTLSSCANITGVTWDQGQNNVTVYANDSSGRVSSDVIRFNIDTTDPTITIDAPASDNQWYSVNTTDITFTASDANRDSCWYSLNGGANTSRDCDTDFTTETWAEGVPNTITIWVNDTAGRSASATRTWNTDSVAPVVSYNYSRGLPTNNTFLSTNTLYFAVNYTELNPSSAVPFYHYISTGWLNPCNSTGGNGDDDGNLDVVTSDGKQRLCSKMIDEAGSVGWTEELWITVDTTAPVLSIDTPSNATWTTDNGLDVTYTLTETNPDSCWWNDNGGSNTTLASCTTDITSPTWSDGTHVITIYANDSAGWTDSESITFYVDSVTPQISISYPTATTYGTSPTTLNYSYTESNPDTCWYNTGGSNTTLGSCTNVTGLTASSGSNTWTIYINDSAGHVNSSSVTFTYDDVAPDVSWSAQSPSDLDSTNALGIGVDINYSISDSYSALDNDSIKFYAKVNTTLTDVFEYINGTAVQGYIEHSFDSNISDIYMINLQDHELYPATYNIEDSIMDVSAHTQQVFNNKNKYIAIELINVSNDTGFNFFEAMVNSTGIVRAYYCNDQYDFASDPTGSAYCYNFYNIDTNADYDHQHSSESSHQLFPFYIDEATGQSGGIDVTSTSYFLLRGNNQPSKPINVYTVAQTSRVGAMRTTDDQGSTWTNQTYTVDGHIHQYTAETTLYYYACANDTWDNDACSVVQTDLFGLGGISPFPPSVTSPVENGNYSSLLPISYTASTSPNGYDISKYNITLVDENYTYVATITADNGLDLTYNYDSSGVANGEYYVAVRVFDNNSLSSTGYSDIFKIDNTDPNATLHLPVNETITDETAINFTANISDDYTGVQNTTLHIYNESGSLYNETTVENSGVMSGYVGILVNLVDGVYHWWYSLFDTAGNEYTTENRTITIDTTNPTVTIVKPQAKSYNQNTSIPINFTVTDVNLDSCWYNLNGGTNISITCNTNATFGIGEGSHTFYAFANDTAGNLGTDSQSFSVNLAPPSTEIHTPEDETWINYNNNIDFNYTATDSEGVDHCSLYGDWNGGWHLNETDSDVTSGVLDTFTKNLSDGTYTWNIWCEDLTANGEWASPSANLTVYVDGTTPLIEWNQTIPSGSASTSTSLYASINLTESNLQYVKWNLYLDGVLTLSNTYYNATIERNWTSLVDGNYSYNVTAVDNATNTNSTTTKNIYLDDTIPDVLIDAPFDQYAYNESIPLETTIVDVGVGLDTCMFSIYHADTLQVYYSNQVYNCSSYTLDLPSGDNDFILDLTVNDTLGNLENIQEVFGIRTVAPAITLENPTDDAHIDYNESIVLNFSVVDAEEDVDTCLLYHDFNGTWILDQTNTSITESTTINWASVNATEGVHYWNVWCNDSKGNGNFGSSNNTLTVDMTDPFVNITSPANGTGTGLTLQFDFNITDTNIDACSFNFQKVSDESWVFSPNQTLTCGDTDKSTTVSAGSYDLYVWATDESGRQGSDTIRITASSPTNPVEGGGNSPPPAVSKTIIKETATNFTIRAGLGGKLDFVLAKGSVLPRTKYFTVTNDGLDAITVNLECTTDELNQSEVTTEGQLINICDYVEFENEQLVISSNEAVQQQVMLMLSVPPNSTFGDVYNFNVVATRTIVESEEVERIQSAKLSVSSRVPIWGMMFKWSYVPLQDSELEESEKKAYPVAPIAVLFSFIVFAIIFLVFHKKMALTGFSLGTLLFFVTFGLLLFLL